MDDIAPPPGLAPRRGPLLAVAVLVFAGYNVFARLDREMVDVWDESLYAITALEMVGHGRWAVTTFNGQPDFMNIKPPLNSWLIAAGFKARGEDLLALRLPAATSAFLTIVTLLVWGSARWGAGVGLLSALVLSTTYGFLYVHSGRTANADAPLTLAVTWTAVLAWESQRRPWLSAAHGLLSAAVFMLKGPGALAYVIPLVLADVWNRLQQRPRRAAWATPYAVALASFLLPVGAWAYARWRFDGFAFLGRLLAVDTVGRAAEPLQGHEGSWLFYLDVLQRHQFDWLFAGGLALALAPSVLTTLAAWLRRWGDPERRVALAWVVATMGVPTLVATKLAWYLNSFYPLFALGVALALSHAWRASTALGRPRRAAVVLMGALVAATVAEARMAYRSRVMVDLDRSAQQLLIEHAPALAGRRVFAPQWPPPELFLIRRAGARGEKAESAAAFREASAPGDLWIDGPDAVVEGADRLGANRRASLHRRR